MARQNCSGARSASLSFELERLQVRQGLEDTPMNQINVREELAAEAAEENCTCTWQEELLALLDCQNRLLYDILGAINSLTAAQLALSGSSGT